MILYLLVHGDPLPTSDPLPTGDPLPIGDLTAGGSNTSPVYEDIPSLDGKTKKITSSSYELCN